MPHRGGYGPSGYAAPPLDADPAEIVRWVKISSWEDWLPAYRPWWRQIEENVRMLSGRHWDVFIDSLGDFVDLSSWFASGDDRWRRYPVFNWVAHYYKLTLSKLTENVPAMGYVPGSPDELDARLAQIMEPVWKSTWNRIGMPELMYQLYGWVIGAARGIPMWRWNPDLGPAEEFTGPAVIRLLGPDGVQIREISDAPYVAFPDMSVYPHILNTMASDAYGAPLVDPESGEPIFEADEAAEGGLRMGPANRHRLGDIEASVISPVSLITPYGPEPFSRKPWYCHMYLEHVDEIARRFDVDVEPESLTSEDLLQLRLEYGSNYGIPSFGFAGSGGPSQASPRALEGMARVYEKWCRDVPGHPSLGEGRVTAVCRDQVLLDDRNPYWTETHKQVVMPFEAFDLIRYPFRQEGTSDLEILNPLNRAIDRRMGGLMDAVDYNEQPLTIFNRAAGIEEDPSELNRPGATTEAYFSQGPPVMRLPPAELPRSSQELAKILQDWMQLLGSQPFGSEGLPVTSDASGELQREVRFDTDRVWGATLRLHSYAWARAAEKIMGIYAACMSDDRIFTLAGTDSGWDFLAVKAQMFQGTVHAFPMPESAVLESRQEKQNRLLGLHRAGLIPPEKVVELLGYPDLTRAIRPGGPAYGMAERENLEIALGILPPVLPEHDHQIHILLHRRRMQSVEFRDADPGVQQRLRIHVRMHEMAMTAQQLPQLLAAAQQATAAGQPGEAPRGPGGGAPFAGAPEPRGPQRPSRAPRAPPQAVVAPTGPTPAGTP